MEQFRVDKTVSAYILDFEELSPITKLLFDRAIRDRKNAQAPYSNFYVGVAVLSESGSIYSGCNVERVSWTQTTHAEQNAIDSMVAYEGPAKLRTLALVAAPKGEEIIIGQSRADRRQYEIIDIPVPCGHCLQIIWENCFDDPSVPLMSVLPDGKISRTSIGDALPMRFGPADLGVDYSKIKEG